jgi:hypothetical protein
MRSRLIVLFVAVSFCLALAIENNAEPASKTGLACAAVVGVILGSNSWTPIPADVQSRLLLQEVVRERPEEQDD